jgi:hypothetical protein
MSAAALYLHLTALGLRDAREREQRHEYERFLKRQYA